MISTILEVISQSDFVLLALAILIFDLPRYTLSLIAVTFVGFSRTSGRSFREDVRWGAVVTAHNSGPAVLRTLKSLRDQTIPPVKIMVIDDGSTDQTRWLLEDALAEGLADRLIVHELRCGTSMSVNHAIRFLNVDYVLNVDSDTELSSDAVALMLEALTDENIAGVSGNLLVANPRQSIWTSLQSIEYLISITAGRRFLSLIHALPAVSGAFMLFRRDAFMLVGGLSVGPGEDFDISIRLRRAGFRLTFSDKAFAWTYVPQTFLSLVRQRLRWDRDAFRIRILTFGEFRLFAKREELGETLQRLDYLTFELLPSIIFPFYFAYLVILFGPDALSFLFALYIFLLFMEMLNIAVVMAFVPHRLTLFEAITALTFPIYQGIVMKVLRFWAFTSEILWQESSHDDYVPPRIRAALYGRIV